MIQGTGSHVGKSAIVAGLCRALARRGMKVAPFKPQNMSNNAAVAPDGGEIGRAQALQARAAGVASSVHMNPVLLKPESDTGAQVIVQGRRFGTMRAVEYGGRKAELLAKVLESFAIVGEGNDVVLVEGAGSPAETNLRAGDIANMGFAEAAGVPAVLLGDIDRGGVIASLVGTYEVLAGRDRKRIKGFLINKFRGDAGLFDEGLATVEARTGWPCLGVIPWFEAARALPAEDMLGLDAAPRTPSFRPTGPANRRPEDKLQPESMNREAGDGVAVDPGFRRGDEKLMGMRRIVIAVPALRRIANFDDLDPLRAEPGVSLAIVRPGEPIPGDANLILIPGTKSTMADLAFLREQGWDIDILAHRRRGGQVLGLCGGYQMLGRTIADPDGIEGQPGTVAGLELLDVDTVIGGDKTTAPVVGRHVPTGEAVSGYEIHLGRTLGPDCARTLVDLGGREEGAQSADGRVAGTYVHGLFAADGFRHAFLGALGGGPSETRYEAMVEQALDELADHLERHVDIGRLLAIAASESRAGLSDGSPASSSSRLLSWAGRRALP